MKVERCLINGEISTSPTGKLYIPEGTFSNISFPSRFIAIKKNRSKKIRLVIIENSDDDIYEIYCEIWNKMLAGKVLKTVSGIIMGNDGIDLLDSDGICMEKDADKPCTFDGFVTVSKNSVPILEKVKASLQVIDSVTDISITKLE